ncbi:hypothetical protein B9479_002242 [Cryptococcus floricola]|uniref:T-cell immunomodulatory protein TIP C2 domain-containing protein n=1 Tax=Cryptococcus floricola TaxID=2591691 RepID=A0A5D3B4A6_9TREE|nr:hypothetical protein B9479_002242 [Cryptococcus floricola]
MPPSKLALLLSFLLFSAPSQAIWPFKEKRFKDEAFIDAGSLGLGKLDGRVAAVGDWNGDSKLDLFTLSNDGKTVQVYLWDKDKFKYKLSHTLALSSTISNIVPGDFNHDGHLDLLLMYDKSADGGWWGGKTERLGMDVHLGGGPNGGFQPESWSLPISTPAQPIVFDADGSLRPSLLGYHPTESSDGIVTWKNNGTGFSLETPPLRPIDQVCSLANPHSSAFIDIDGDCLPDLVLHCTRTTGDSLQIWLNRADAGYVLSRNYNLPPGSGPITFADMNRDGSIDIVFATCSQTSSSTGLGSDCQINIAYNKQVPLCSTEASQWIQEGVLKCRGWGDMCISDEKFEFAFDDHEPNFISVPIASLSQSTSKLGLLLHAPGKPSLPSPLRPGDYNVDGFPDLLFVMSTDKGTQVQILESIACGKNVAGCGKGIARGWRLGSGKDWEDLEEIEDAIGASWLDLDEDASKSLGSLDIMVQRSGKQDKEKVTFVQNNFYHDAFFLKTEVLNGVCSGKCEPSAGGKSYSPLGVSYSGATYKLTVLDTVGNRVAQQVAQLPQTGYQALQTPYAFFGLGRTNNYIEKLFIGASLLPPNHITYLDSLIPNSQVLINPPYPSASEEESGERKTLELQSPVKARSTEWKSQLYLKPGDWVPWVGAAVLGTVLVLGTVVLGLNEKEKKEDEVERQRALHAINFQAL